MITTAFGLWLFPFLLCILLSLMLCDWLVTEPLCPLLLVPSLFQISPSIYTPFCLPAPPILSPASLLAVQFLIRSPGVLDRQRITASQS